MRVYRNSIRSLRAAWSWLRQVSGDAAYEKAIGKYPAFNYSKSIFNAKGNWKVNPTGARLVSLTTNANGVALDVQAHTAFLQLGNDRAEMCRIALRHPQIAASDGACQEEGARLDAVRDDRVVDRRQLVDTFDLDGRRAGYARSSIL